MPRPTASTPTRGGPWSIRGSCAEPHLRQHPDHGADEDPGRTADRQRARTRTRRPTALPGPVGMSSHRNALSQRWWSPVAKRGCGLPHPLQSSIDALNSECSVAGVVVPGVLVLGVVLCGGGRLVVVGLVIADGVFSPIGG